MHQEVALTNIVTYNDITLKVGSESLDAKTQHQMQRWTLGLSTRRFENLDAVASSSTWSPLTPRRCLSLSRLRSSTLTRNLWLFLNPSLLDFLCCLLLGCRGSCHRTVWKRKPLWFLTLTRTLIIRGIYRRPQVTVLLDISDYFLSLPHGEVQFKVTTTRMLLTVVQAQNGLRVMRHVTSAWLWRTTATSKA